MLSWNDEADVSSMRAPMTGSLSRPGRSFEAQRTVCSRKSVDMPASPGKLISPINSLTKANSLLRGPGNSADGTIGSEGWWHHMDTSQMNDRPFDDTKSHGQAKEGAAFVYENNTTGHKQSLWEGETPAAAAPPPAAPSPAGSDTAVEAPARVAPTAPAASAAAAAPAAAPAPAAPAAGEAADTVQNAKVTGWWAHMDASVLNQLAEAAPLEPGAVRGGERAVGGSFTPQLNITGGNHYGSIFGEEVVQHPAPQRQQQQSGCCAQDSLELKVAEWGPFCGQQGASAAGGASAEDDWSTFASAPKA